MIKTEINQNGLVADFFTNPSNPTSRAILMLGGSEGGKSWSRIKKPLELLVQKGYSVFSLAYFKAGELPGTLQEIPLEYFEKAFAWLSTQPGIIPDQFGIIGGSKGSEAALLLASRYSQIKAVIGFSPSSVVWQGIPGRRFKIGDDVKSSWSYGGEGITYLPYPSPVNKRDLITLRLRKMHEDALLNSAGVDKAAIPVENIQGGILLISGEGDRLWPATPMSEEIMRRLKSKGFQYPSEHLVFKTGHNGIVMNKDSWRRVFLFLEETFL